MRKKVLVVIHPDHVEAYADDDVDVRFAHFPKVCPEGEVRGEKYVEGTLPLNYRSLYFQGNLRGQDVLRCLTPFELADWSWQLEMHKSLDKAQELLSTPF